MKRIFFATLMLFIFTALTFAQSTTGRLLGTVSGPDGLLAGATVTVTDNQTGREITATADDKGGFKFEQITFGTYTVRVTSQGFKTFVANDVKIDANREYTLNPQLEVGEVSAEVVVQAGADILNSSTAELSSTVSPRQVLELPVNGRNPLSLLNLQAGVNATSNSINGQRSSSTNFTRDGINVQDNFIRTGGFVIDQPTVDDTGEFTVVTQNAGAELGNGGSAQVLLITPRGGKDFHGALFEYNRNSRFAANDFGLNATGQGKAFLNRNQFGGKISGPVPVPGFGEGTPFFFKNKGFFFASYERFELRQTAQAPRTILTAPFRNGTFSYLDNTPMAQGGPILRTVNLLTGAGLDLSTPGRQTSFNNAGGVLAVDPTIQRRFLALTPSVGNSIVRTKTNTGQVVVQDFLFAQSDNETRNGFTGRFDLDINDRNRVYFVYKHNGIIDDRPDADTGGFGVKPFTTQGGPTDTYIVNYQTIFGANFSNEVRGAYVPSNPFFNQPSTFPADFVIGGLPFGLSTPEPDFQSQGRNTKQYTFQDNATYTFGKHSMRFGVEYNAERIKSLSSFNQVPIFDISSTGNLATPSLPSTLFPGGINPTDRATANALRFLLGGIVGDGSVAANAVNGTSGPAIGAPLSQRLNYNTIGAYVSDQWRITPELTLNLGLRYDYFTPLRNPDQVYLEPDLQGAKGFDNIRKALLNPNGQYVLVGANSGKPGQFFKGDKNNFGPVLGVAYSPRETKGFLGTLLGREGQTVIRGGFRIGYINDEYVRSADNAAGGNAGLSTTVAALQNGSSSLNARFTNLPTFTLPPFTAPPISFADGNLNDGSFFNAVFAIDPNIQTQRNMQYSFGIQREIGFDTAIEVRYVGGRSNSLVRAYDFNQINLNASNFLRDFINARNNCRIQGATLLPAGSTADPLLACTDASNLGLPGQVNLPAFDALPFGAFLDNPAVTGPIGQGNAADLALIYITNGLDGFIDNGQFVGVNFRANPNAGVVDFLTNSGRYRYNALQAEIRRRFTKGLTFQANYTFQKILTDVQSDQQTRFDPLLDINNPGLEYARADYDRTHTININAIYELPFGKGKPFLNKGGLMNAIFGGFQVTSIINISSGVPITIKDTGGTLNRGGRSGRQTAFSNLTTDQIKNLVGIFKVGGNIYFIDPKVIAIPNSTSTSTSATGTNVGQSPRALFPGQVFFRNQPGQTGNLPRNFLNGPWYYNWDAGIIKNIAFNETVRLQLRAEAFNVLNRTNFFVAENSNIFNISSNSFGQIAPSSTYGPRILQFAVRFEF